MRCSRRITSRCGPARAFEYGAAAAGGWRDDVRDVVLLRSGQERSVAEDGPDLHAKLGECQQHSVRGLCAPGIQQRNS